MPAMTEIVDKQQIRAGPAGRAPEVNIPNDRAGLSLDKYNSMPEIPGIKQIEKDSGSVGIDRLLETFGKNESDINGLKFMN